MACITPGEKHLYLLKLPLAQPLSQHTLNLPQGKHFDYISPHSYNCAESTAVQLLHPLVRHYKN